MSISLTGISEPVFCVVFVLSLADTQDILIKIIRIIPNRYNFLILSPPISLCNIYYTHYDLKRFPKVCGCLH